MQLAEQLAGLVLADLEQHYFKGWAVLKEDAQRIVREAMERVRNGTAPLKTVSEVQARLGEHRRDEVLTVEMIQQARNLATQSQLARTEARAIDQQRNRDIQHAREMMEGAARAEIASHAMDAMIYGSSMTRTRPDGIPERVPPETWRLVNVPPVESQWTREELAALDRIGMEPSGSRASPSIRRNR